jgi:hypothetical protein
MKTIGLLRLSAAGALTIAAALAPAASAHHAITLNYDPRVTGAIEGEVVEVFWANPHVHYYLNVAADDGSVRLWDMETGNLNSMRTRGVGRDTIKVGDRVRATGVLGRDGHSAILADSLTMEDGRVLWGNPEAVVEAENYGPDDE